MSKKKKETIAEQRDRLRDDCNKALHCLYIAAPEHVARDVNIKVKAYIDFLCDSGMKLAAGLTAVEAKIGAKCFRCDGTGLLCNICGESERVCRCAASKFADCSDCKGTGI